MSFRREPFKSPAGARDGGRRRSGRGRHASWPNPERNTLLALRHGQRAPRAARGRHGGSNNKTGASARGAVASTCRVERPSTTPPTSGALIGEVLDGGRTPRGRQGRPGGPGQPGLSLQPQPRPARGPARHPLARNIGCRLELKLLADVGLLGLPNAGKSTLLAHVSRADPRSPTIPSRPSRRCWVWWEWTRRASWRPTFPG